MSKFSDLNEDIKAALKSGEKLKVLVLRMLKAAIHNETITKKQTEVDEELFLSVLKREVKKRREAIVSYKQGGRDDLVDKEQQELDILEVYLPPQLTDTAIEKVIGSVLRKLPDSEKNFGNVMKNVMSELAGQADGKLVGELVKKHI